MTQQSTTATIRAALGKMAAGDLTDAPTQLLAALGYRSDRLLDGQTGNVGHFISDFKADNADTRSEQDFLDSTKEVRILFQFTDTEIAATGQRRLLDAEAFSAGNASSFLFAAVDLNGDTYPRGRYVSFTREINKRFNRMPAAVIFRTADGRVTLAFVNRRPSKVRDDRQVLGSVSLIREVNPATPHRAHLDILSELSLGRRLDWMRQQGKAASFDGLLSAWLEALDTEELNRRFYRELKDWFDRAVKEARFPTSGARALKPEEHVIRLITRMLFVWFVKEKDLVAEDLFVENRIASLLEEYDRAEGDSYYRAVLQNLFFATLNTEIGRRSFSSQTNTTYRDFSRYRYAREIADPDALLSLFGKTPFINGGLFDCLDSEEAPRDGGYRIDYFSDNVLRKGTEEYGKLSIPNRLFFDDGGLITLFNHYKFTIEENTPAEQEVALDPELLGKVFENLLAAYNPETRESARKQTGSYYTPRAIVDYMVDEALVGSIVRKVSPDDGDYQWWEERLHYLLDYNDADDLFLSEEAARVIRAIAELKVLDPAVGSGAFPMSVLHKLTLALRRLDPENVLWRTLQEEIHGGQASDAFRKQGGEEQRARILEEINANFERYKGSDYGRKLYLIQNSIYGVDIQPVATQIAKLRFFISLAIEQQPDPSADNYGIQPLPNLETRFVAANSLLGLDKKALQIPLGGQNRVTELNDQLRENRERHFHAGVRREKLRLRAEDRRLRADLAMELEKAGMSKSDSGKIASWDPYDQNAHAGWFDPGYMFDIRDGFDVVIGNPPYVVVKDRQLRELYKEGVYGRMNTYGLFIQRGLQLAGEGGHLTYINPRTLLTDRYFTNLRKVIRQTSQLKGVVLISDRHNTFESVLQECIILHLVRKANSPKAYTVGIRSISRPGDLTDPQILSLISSERVLLGDEYDGALFIGSSEFDYHVFEKMNAIGVKLAAWGLKAETGKIQFDKYQEYVQANNANGACRLIWAENVQRYALAPTVRRAGREWLKKSITGVISPSITGSGIVTQRVTANEQPRRIIATLISPEDTGTERVYSENHTNFIPLKENTKGYFILAALNSSPFEFLFRRLNSNTQVSAGELNALPFPPLPDDKTLEEIESLVSDLLDWNGVECTLGNFDRALAHEHGLDLLIGSLYGFSSEEVAQIQATMPSHKFLYDPVPEEEDQALLRAMLEVSIDNPEDFVSEADVMATLRGLRDSHGA